MKSAQSAALYQLQTAESRHANVCLNTARGVRTSGLILTLTRSAFKADKQTT